MSQSSIAVNLDDELEQGNSVLPDGACEESRVLLRDTFDAEFEFFDGRTGECLSATSIRRGCDWELIAESIREVARRGQPEVIWEADPVMLLAIPLINRLDDPLVALGLFACGEPTSDRPLESLADELQLNLDEATEWLNKQPVLPAKVLMSIGTSVVQQLASDARIAALEEETFELAQEITSTYEEITLLHRLTHKSKLSSSVPQLGQESLKWLDEVIQAEGFALQIVTYDHTPQDESASDCVSRFIERGDVPIDSDGLTQLVEHFSLKIDQRPLVLNHMMTKACCELFPGIRELVIVPLTEGERLFGWLAVFNHESDGEFGTVEANLLSTVATILGIHSGNIELYRQQSELMAGIVKALTSAIDAKDPYTCGHSDRVARVAVRLGQELGYDQETLKTIYMAGLLHDVGKIGVSDQVLGKTGPLTPDEYEHIKTHVEIGYRILVDLKQMGNVLPLVRHHHEAWDGTGYPHQLAGEEIPELARLAAVADSFDAMSSDRPYRRGMDDKRIDAIFRNGSGKQWDPRVVEAFFKVRDDIREISGSNADHNVLAV